MEEDTSVDRRSHSRLTSPLPSSVVPDSGQLHQQKLPSGCESVSWAVSTQSAGRRGAYFLATQYGSKLVKEILAALNWQEVHDFYGVGSSAPSLTLVWCNGCQADLFIRKMRPGHHIVSRLPGTRALTNKMLLPDTLRLQDAAPQCRCVGHPRLTADAILPPTYVLRTALQRLQFLRRLRAHPLWICKPAALNRGEGIKLVRSEVDFRNLFNDDQTSGQPKRDWIIQQYIARPLLLDGKKFDLRVYLLVLATANLNCLAFYHPGYVRLTCRGYDIQSDDLCLHLTNQAVQQKDSAYETAREETIWPIDRLNDYLNAGQSGVGRDFVLTRMQDGIRHVLAHLVAATRPKLAASCGCFELLGCDFLVEATGKVWLLELNSTPALGLYNAAQAAIIPGVVHEAVGIAVEAFSKHFRRQPVLPLKLQREFQLIYDSSSRPRQPRPSLHQRQPPHLTAAGRARSMPALNSLAKSTENLAVAAAAAARESTAAAQPIERRRRPPVAAAVAASGSARRMQKAKSSLALTQVGVGPAPRPTASTAKLIGTF